MDCTEEWFWLLDSICLLLSFYPPFFSPIHVFFVDFSFFSMTRSPKFCNLFKIPEIFVLCSSCLTYDTTKKSFTQAVVWYFSVHPSFRWTFIGVADRQIRRKGVSRTCFVPSSYLQYLQSYPVYCFVRWFDLSRKGIYI